ncbi:FG-GAP repeat domain-containing protein [Krasilnikovia sp. MM14-A1259]|uniref:FG-GAP repeat domain-containing protein n=1 Tax=Krasilnikovia sp. MM14-A1259 TaxID=3373539 RepID=UPI003829C845
MGRARGWAGAKAATAGVTAALAAVFPATAGMAATPAAGAQAGAAAVAEPTNRADDVDKVKAAGVLGINPDSGMLGYNDQQFVLALWRAAKDGTFVKAAALRAYTDEDSDAAYAFIKTGIFAAEADDAQVEIAAEKAKAVRRSVAVTVGLDPKDTALIEKNDRDFIFSVWQRVDPDSRVWAAAKQAIRDGSTQDDWTAFLAGGAQNAAEQDRADAIAKADGDKAAKLRAAQLADGKRALLQLLLIPVSEELVVAPNKEFVQAIRKQAKGTEVQLAAQAALLTAGSDSDLDKALSDFIFTGGAAANTRDEQAADAKELAGYKSRVSDTLDAARRSGFQPNLTAAAQKALDTGTLLALQTFLLKGQDEAVAKDTAARKKPTLLYAYSNGAVGPFSFNSDGNGALYPRSGYKSAASSYNIARLTDFNGDFNGDGVTDQAVLQGTTDNGYTLDTFLGKQDGSYQAPARSWTSKSFGSWDRLRMTSGDYNGDGRTDLAGFFNYSDHSMGLFLWTARADGTFGTPTRAWFHAAEPYWGELGRMKIFSGDFNGDGRADVGTFYQYADHSVGLISFLSNPDGTTFQNPFRSWYRAPEPYWGEIPRLKIVAGDFNGDHRTDVAGMYNYASGDLALMTFTAKTDGGFNGAFSSWRSNAAQFGKWERTKLAAADYNGDGRDDLAALVGKDDETLTWQTFTSKADGGFNTPLQSWTSAPGKFGWLSGIRMAGE